MSHHPTNYYIASMADTHVHINTYTHTNTHTQTHTRTHAHTNTHTYTYRHPHRSKFKKSGMCWPTVNVHVLNFKKTYIIMSVHTIKY